MKTKDQKTKFIVLRAKGLSFDKISKEIDVSKPTLIKWNQDFYKQISSLEYIEAQSLVELHQYSAKQKLEVYSKKLREVYQRLENIDISDFSFKEIIEFKNYLELRLEDEKRKFEFYTGESKEVLKYPSYDCNEVVIEDERFKLE